MSSSQARAELAEAVRLFNAGEYHACHEVLDELWEGPEGPDTDFYKGLIQAAICLHHFARGNMAGAKKLYSGHRRYLAAYLPQHLGIDLADLLTQMQSCLRPVVRARQDEFVAFDRERRPQLVYAAEAPETS